MNSQYFNNDELPSIRVEVSDVNLAEFYYYVSGDENIINLNLSSIQDGMYYGEFDEDLWRSLDQDSYINITFVAVDEAGNISEEWVIIITQVDYYITEKPIYGIIFAILAVLGMALFVSIYKQKQSKETTTDTKYKKNRKNKSKKGKIAQNNEENSLNKRMRKIIKSGPRKGKKTHLKNSNDSKNAPTKSKFKIFKNNLRNILKRAGNHSTASDVSTK